MNANQEDKVASLLAQLGWDERYQEWLCNIFRKHASQSQRLDLDGCYTALQHATTMDPDKIPSYYRAFFRQPNDAGLGLVDFLLGLGCVNRSTPHAEDWLDLRHNLMFSFYDARGAGVLDLDALAHLFFDMMLATQTTPTSAPSLDDARQQAVDMFGQEPTVQYNDFIQLLQSKALQSTASLLCREDVLRPPTTTFTSSRAACESPMEEQEDNTPPSVAPTHHLHTAAQSTSTDGSARERTSTGFAWTRAEPIIPSSSSTNKLTSSPHRSSSSSSSSPLRFTPSTDSAGGAGAAERQPRSTIATSSTAAAAALSAKSKREFRSPPRTAGRSSGGGGGGCSGGAASGSASSKRSHSASHTRKRRPRTASARSAREAWEKGVAETAAHELAAAATKAGHHYSHRLLSRSRSGSDASDDEHKTKSIKPSTHAAGTSAGGADGRAVPCRPASAAATASDRHIPHSSDSSGDDGTDPAGGSSLDGSGPPTAQRPRLRSPPPPMSLHSTSARHSADADVVVRGTEQHQQQPQLQRSGVKGPRLRRVLSATGQGSLSHGWQGARRDEAESEGVGTDTTDAECVGSEDNAPEAEQRAHEGESQQEQHLQGGEGDEQGTAGESEAGQQAQVQEEDRNEVAQQSNIQTGCCGEHQVQQQQPQQQQREQQQEEIVSLSTVGVSMETPQHTHARGNFDKDGQVARDASASRVYSNSGVVGDTTFITKTRIQARGQLPARGDVGEAGVDHAPRHKLRLLASDDIECPTEEGLGEQDEEGGEGRTRAVADAGVQTDWTLLGAEEGASSTDATAASSFANERAGPHTADDGGAGRAMDEKGEACTEMCAAGNHDAQGCNEHYHQQQQNQQPQHQQQQPQQQQQQQQQHQQPQQQQPQQQQPQQQQQQQQQQPAEGSADDSAVWTGVTEEGGASGREEEDNSAASQYLRNLFAAYSGGAEALSEHDFCLFLTQELRVPGDEALVHFRAYDVRRAGALSFTDLYRGLAFAQPDHTNDQNRLDYVYRGYADPVTQQLSLEPFILMIKHIQKYRGVYNSGEEHRRMAEDVFRESQVDLESGYVSKPQFISACLTKVPGAGFHGTEKLLRLPDAVPLHAESSEETQAMAETAADESTHPPLSPTPTLQPPPPPPAQLQTQQEGMGSHAVNIRRRVIYPMGADMHSPVSKQKIQHAILEAPSPAAVVSVDTSVLVERVINTALDPEYTPPRTADGVTEPFNLLTQEELMTVIPVAQAAFAADATVTEVMAPVKVFGDIHGQLHDLLTFFRIYGMPHTIHGDVHYLSYLFIGDFVDRGSYSLEVMTLLMCLKLRYPQRIFLVRGNHEDPTVNSYFGFKDECHQRLPDGLIVWHMINRMFDYLPLGAIVERSILCVHGGIGQYFQYVDDLRRVQRPFRWSDENEDEALRFMARDCLWSDPTASDSHLGLRASDTRGTSVGQFGPDMVRTFLENNSLQMIVRAHQCVPAGYEFFASQQLVTVFSATNYCNRFGNDAAMLVINRELSVAMHVIKPDSYMGSVSWQPCQPSSPAPPSLEPDGVNHTDGSGSSMTSIV